ncbi:MAG TPA: hypothetical protein VGS18_01400, partial [Thermoplasmata archaeon]|nr:hypothetical protein [Thermoplasmata archaeon]
MVGVVASMLDEVRPRLVEARQLGRDPSEVFASMNRAREALRLKIYSEALAASAEAIEKVSQLTVDLDTAREEVESLKRLVEQLAALKVPTAPFVEGIERAGRELDRVELDRARSTLRETVRTLGRESARHFGGELERLRVVSSIARERGFLPPGTEERLAEARTLLADGSFHPAGEALASIDVALRTSAGPFVARRVEEIEKGFSEVTDADLLATTRRYLADADVALRVKDDLTQSMESLKRAEHEFAVVFASQASSHLEQLEADLRLFDEMGGTGPELQRQVDEVQQIFNMGDFVKAARASQDLLARAAETKQQRAATAISHAKLALVELTQMGIDPLDLRTRFEAAQNEAREGHVVEAYRGCVGVQEEASRLRTDAEAASDYLNQAIERSKKLEESGLDVRKFRTEIDAAREAYRNLDFDGVRAHVDAVNTVLEAAAEEAEALRLVGESESLMEDARRLGIPTDINEANIADGRAAVLAGERGKGLVLIQGTHAGLLKLLHPVLEENLKSIEQDFEIARNSGLDLGEIAEVLADARRRITRKVPIGAAEQLERARTQLTESRGFLEHAERAAKRVEEAFGQAELLKVATAPMRSRAEAIDRALKDRAYPKVIDLSGSLEREILQTINQHVARTIAGLQGMLVHARQEGAPTAAAENLLSQGRQALHEGRPMDALQLAARSESEIERLGLQTRIARAAFETLETKLARFESEGIKAPLATDLFRQALAALEAHDHPKALDLVLQALDLLAEAREFHRRAREALDLADRQVQEAMELGAELNEVIG